VVQKNCPVRIFATDVDEEVLKAARRGIYAESVLANVSPERLARFFIRARGASYEAGRQLREVVFFARHNFLMDSPFSRLDLIVCRDLLVHLELEVQKRIFEVLHYALDEGGCLFLGTSDPVDQNLDLFEPMDRTWRIYRRKGPARASTMRFPVMKAERRPVEADLSTGTAKLESMIEELRQTNQETTTLNEELQTANEELQTSEEELRVLNSELVTVNSQLQEKNEALETANNDIANLFNSTEIATVFLDPCLRIKRFTPATTRLLRLLATDVGRPLGDIAKKFTDDDLLPDAQRVLRDHNAREKEVHADDGRWYARRILPYRTLDNRFDGVVITFVDITERKQAADAIWRRLAAIIESFMDAIFSKALDGTIRTWNQGAEWVFGYLAEEAVGRSAQMLIPQDHAVQWRRIMRQLAAGSQIERLETKRLHKNGRRVPVKLTYSPLRDEKGKVVGVSGTARDISERKRAEETLRVREELLQAILETVADAITTIDYEGIIQSVNGAAARMFSYSTSELVGQNVKMLMPSPDREAHDSYLARYLQTGEKHIIGISRETQAQRKDGTVFPTELAVSEIKHLRLFTGIHRDLTERKRLERDLVEAASLEQRRIGQDLHDSVAQELTALNLLVTDLAEILPIKPAKTAQLVERLQQGLQRSQQELRAVLRGLLPVAVDAEGLMAALADLANRTQQERQVNCTFDCPTPVTVADNLTAT
jgi:two-component system CheB/CheR fusion protein